MIRALGEALTPMSSHFARLVRTDMQTKRRGLIGGDVSIRNLVKTQALDQPLPCRVRCKI